VIEESILEVDLLTHAIGWIGGNKGRHN